MITILVPWGLLLEDITKHDILSVPNKYFFPAASIGAFPHPSLGEEKSHRGKRYFQCYLIWWISSASQRPDIILLASHSPHTANASRVTTSVPISLSFILLFPSWSHKGRFPWETSGNQLKFLQNKETGNMFVAMPVSQRWKNSTWEGFAFARQPLFHRLWCFFFAWSRIKSK